MSDAGKAVFLSYASQDAEAAKRICDALRQAGVEVWFDQSELRGGDAWDQQIRRQIKECALFVPIISQHTQERLEGYFRREWRLAAERMHDMDDTMPFLVPVVVDDTPDAAARVPERFRERQWTRLPGGETPPAFGERMKVLLSGGNLAPEHPAAAPRGDLNPEELAKLVAAVQAMVPKTAAARRESEDRQLVIKARQLFEAPEVTNRENILLAGQLCDKAVALDPADVEVWAARAQLSYVMAIYGHDRTPARLHSMVSDAERAMALAPNSYEARLASAYALARQPPRWGEAEKIFRSLLVENAADKRAMRNLGHVLRRQGRNDEAFALYDQAAALPGGDPIALADKANAYVFLARLPEAEKAAEQSLVQAPTGRAYLIQTLLQLVLHGDTDRARDTLQQVPAGVLREDRGVNIATWVWLWRREPERALGFLRSVPRDYIADIHFTGPKAVLAGWAHQLAGHPEAARAEWEAALAVLERRSQEPGIEDRLVRCELLARLGRQAEAGRLFDQTEQTEGAGWRRTGTAPLKLLVLLGRNDDALALIPELIDRPSPGVPLTRWELRLNPWYDTLRGNPRFQALLAEAPTARPAAGSPVSDTPSIAVLPFVNLTRDEENEYFADGLAEELLNVLAKIRGLRVAARTSSFSFKGQHADIGTMAAKLNVATLLEGSVRKAGNRVRITAQLINAADGYHLWSETYNRELDDIFAVQDDIAQSVVKELQARLLGPRDAPTVQSELQVATRGRTANAEAHRLYLQGRYLFRRHTNRDVATAIGLYEQALALDPQFALAWAGLGLAIFWQSAFGLSEDERAFAEGFARAEMAAKRSLELEPELPEGFLALSLVIKCSQRNFSAGEFAVRQALALAPGDSEIVGQAASQILIRGRFDEALVLARRSTELDPLNDFGLYCSGRIHLAAGRPAEAEQAFRRAIDLNPHARGRCLHLSWTLLAQQRIAEAEAAALQEEQDVFHLQGLAMVRWAQDRKAEADTLLAELTNKFGVSAAYQVAEVHAHRGEIEAAFHWLDRAFEVYDPGIFWAKITRFFQPLHGDPRWPALLQKLGFTD